MKEEGWSEFHEIEMIPVVNHWGNKVIDELSMRGERCDTRGISEITRQFEGAEGEKWAYPRQTFGIEGPHEPDFRAPGKFLPSQVLPPE